MDRVRSEFHKQVNGATIHVRLYESGRIECWTEPPTATINAKEYLKQILEEYGIPYNG